MDGLTERDRKEFALVEDAMRTYPLADTPPDFASTVMNRVRATAPTPHFHLSWLDFLISLSIPVTGLLLFVVWSSLPPQAAVYLQTRAILLWQFFQRSHLDWAVLIGGLAIVALFIMMTIQLMMPRFRRPKIVPTISLRIF